MKLVESKNWNRRDFTGVYECEHCGDIVQGYGYDDANFYNNVIPGMQCKKCGKKSESAKEKLVPRHSPDLVM